MRLFIAIQLSDELSAAVMNMMHELTKQGGKGNYITDRNLHITRAAHGDADNRPRVSANREAG